MWESKIYKYSFNLVVVGCIVRDAYLVEQIERLKDYVGKSIGLTLVTAGGLKQIRNRKLEAVMDGGISVSRGNGATDNLPFSGREDGIKHISVSGSGLVYSDCSMTPDRYGSSA